jgi:hypothetical protein
MKRALLVLSVVVAAVVVSRNWGSAAPEPRAAERWSYAMLKLPMQDSTFNIQHPNRGPTYFNDAEPRRVNSTFKDLTQFGQGGWELVSVVPVPPPNPPQGRGSEEYYFVFKRPQH